MSSCSDVLHPNRANVSKDELRSKLSELYKTNKDQVSVFGFRTQYGGGKSTGFALIYDSHEALKKFEPRYRLVRIGAATKVERASRKQRTYKPTKSRSLDIEQDVKADEHLVDREGTQEPCQDSPRYCEGQGCGQEEGQEIDSGFGVGTRRLKLNVGHGDGTGRLCFCIYMLICNVGIEPAACRETNNLQLVRLSSCPTELHSTQS